MNILWDSIMIFMKNVEIILPDSIKLFIIQLFIYRILVLLYIFFVSNNPIVVRNKCSILDFLSQKFMYMIR